MLIELLVTRMEIFQRNRVLLRHMLGSIGIKLKWKIIKIKRPNSIGFGVRSNILKGEFIELVFLI
jgi:hypothetical protein